MYPPPHYKVFTCKDVTWQCVEISQLKNEFPDSAEKFCILQYFRKGAEGRAYHACSVEGKQAVLKFSPQHTFHKEPHDLGLPRPGLVSLGAEQTFWLKLNNIETLILTLCQEPALLMPYIEPLTFDELNEFKDETSSIYSQVTNLFKSCIEKGFYQTDAS